MNRMRTFCCLRAILAVATLAVVVLPSCGRPPTASDAGSASRSRIGAASPSADPRMPPNLSLFTEFRVPPNSGTLTIVTGPDGNLWFTEQEAGKVAKMTPAGVFTEYAVPTYVAGPHGIATGPDGDIWFTELDAGKSRRSQRQASSPSTPSPPRTADP